MDGKQDDGFATDEEVAELAARQMVALANSIGGPDTSGFVDVEAGVVSQAIDAGPDFAFVNTYRTDPRSGRMMRLKIVFNETDDPAVGFAYMHALSGKDVTKQTRKRLERKLWKVCIRGTARMVDGKETVDEDTIHSERFYDSFDKKPQFRAEVTNHCLSRLGVVNHKFSGIDQVAYVPAGSLVSLTPEQSQVTQVTEQSASPATSEHTSAPAETPKATSTVSATSPTSPAGTGNAPLTYSVNGPPRRSSRRGSPGTQPR